MSAERRGPVQPVRRMGACGVVEISSAQLASARKAALQELGCSYEELSKMARRRRWPSLKHRLAWMAYGE